MKRLEPESIADVLRQAIEEQNLTQRLQETRAVGLWAKVVGEPIARRTGRPEVKGGVMTVSVPAAPLRHDLQMSRSQIIDIINRTLKGEVIKEIRFIS